MEGDPRIGPVQEGDLLAGKYRVEQVLGVGAMGVVVAARHEQLQSRVALKFMHEQFYAGAGAEERVERFLREARLAVGLKSEHVAKVYDVGKFDSGAPYIVMEYLSGEDLDKIVTKQAPLPLEIAADWLVQACEAVAEAHAKGIVHRDLKPHNLFLAQTVGDSLQIKVLDFGISRSEGMADGALTGTGAMLGSPLYMSPEQMRSARTVDARTDVWALGVVFYQLLTKNVPFMAESLPDLCLRVVNEPHTPLEALRPDLPIEAITIVNRCLEKKPENRFANAAELASALELFVGPATKALAERARSTLRSASKLRAFDDAVRAAAQTSHVVPLPPSSSSSLPVANPALVSGTKDSAWGTHSSAHSSAAPNRARLAIVAGGLVGLATAAAIFFALRSRSPDAAAAAAADPPAAAQALPVAEAKPPATAAQEPALQPAKPEPESAATSPAPVAPPLAPSAAAADTSKPSSAAPKQTAEALGTAGQAGGHSQTPEGRPQSSAHPPSKPKVKASDDDIPALR